MHSEWLSTIYTVTRLGQPTHRDESKRFDDAVMMRTNSIDEARRMASTIVEAGGHAEILAEHRYIYTK